MKLFSERDLVSLALGLLGDEMLSARERALSCGVRPCREQKFLDRIRTDILAGGDPLGEAFSRIRPADARRSDGATYTPAAIISSMLAWSIQEGTPARIVDPGAGSGRFLLACARAFPDAALVGIELDPIVALLLRANISVIGATHRTTILVGDYRQVGLPRIAGPTLFIGNPPYVRHHGINEDWKKWFAASAANFQVKASKLAGLHIHFFVRTLQLAQPGDYGTFITSAEWLDVNYGVTLRQLLADGLGGVALHVIDPAVRPFADATTTGAITCFRVGHRPDTFRVRAVESLEDLKGLTNGTPVSWALVEQQPRWSMIVRPGAPTPRGYIELGEICRVHRGQVTGSNDVWIAGTESPRLPKSVLVPTITKAKDLLAAGDILANADLLRKVIDLPADLDSLPDEDMQAVKRFLAWAKRQGAHQSYIAQHRKAWWSVGLKEPAPIVCTYMARRPPAFVRNLCGARHINVAHGLYPRENFDGQTLDALAAWLRDNVSTANGRTYAGGLTKFEPREVERIYVPRPENLPA